MNALPPVASWSRIARRRTPAGAPPGTLIADRAAAAPTIRVFAYSPDAIVERTVGDVDEVRALLGEHAVVWVDVQGLGRVDLVEALGDAFGLHDLALEDVLNVHQRPKVEPFDDYLFIAARMPVDSAGVETEQVTLFLGKDFVLTFQERPGDSFEPVRERLRHPNTRMRRSGADYLAYGLIDSLIDAYFPVLERYGESVDALEVAVLGDPAAVNARDIHAVKRDLLELRRTLWPLREMSAALLREDSGFVSESMHAHLRDCYDHTVQLMDIVETYREIASGLIDIYLSSLSARMNEIMKVLTIIATIFMPVGVVASIYGMNFDRGVSPWNMPELGWHLGYPFALAIMAAVAVAFLAYFRSLGWIGASRPARRRSERYTVGQPTR